jgi:hypothetical protein
MTTNATTTQNDDAQPAHERRLTTASRLLADADSDADILARCRSTLDKPDYQRCRAQASLDAASVLLALVDSDVDTKRTREARQVLQPVAGGRHV